MCGTQREADLFYFCPARGFTRLNKTIIYLLNDLYYFRAIITFKVSANLINHLFCILSNKIIYIHILFIYEPIEAKERVNIKSNFPKYNSKNGI